MKNLTIRPLNENDNKDVELLDDKSGFYVQQWLEDNTDYAWGAFLTDETGEHLIGYCTTGYADDCCESIEEHELHTCDSILLSDVYIANKYRHNGYGSEMIKKALELRHESDGKVETVFLTIMNNALESFYKPLGFTFINDDSAMTDGAMIRTNNPTEKIDVYLVQKEGITGLTFDEITTICDIMRKYNNNEVFPIELEAHEHECAAMGLISTEAANVLDYDYENSGFHDFIANILDDLLLESPTHTYKFKGLTIVMVY